MSLIGERLKEALTARYGTERVHIGTHPEPVITFKAAHSDVGELAIMDDCDEATIYIGKITHSHFSCYNSDISEVERANQIVDDLTSFLDDLFGNRVLLWVRKDSKHGGWRTLSSETFAPEPDARNYLWSGPLT